MTKQERLTIAEAAGRPSRFMDYVVEDCGIRELFSVKTKWQAWLDVENALAQAEASLGIIPQDAADVISAKSKVELLDFENIQNEMEITQHPLMPLINELSRICGSEASKFLHWGATTQNIMQTGNNLLIRASNERLTSLLVDCLVAAAKLAERESGTVMSGRTHGQHAVPITYGLKVAVWIDEMIRGVDRFQHTAKSVNTTMMSGAVGSFAAIGNKGPEVQKRIANALGMISMRVPTRNNLDIFTDHLWSIAMISATGAKIARDIMTLMQTEISEVFEPLGPGSVGSSTMPQKRNPKLTYDIIELSAEIRSTISLALEAQIHSNEADGSSTSLLDEALSGCLIRLGDLLVRLRSILECIKIDRNRMLANVTANGGLISAEALMIAIAAKSGRQRAHELIYHLAMQTLDSGTDFRKLLLADDEVMAAVSEKDIDELLDPRNHIGNSTDMALEMAAAGKSKASALNANSFPPGSFLRAIPRVSDIDNNNP